MGVFAVGPSFLTRRGGAELRGGGGACSEDLAVGGAIVAVLVSFLERFGRGEVGSEGGSWTDNEGGVDML